MRKSILSNWWLSGGRREYIIPQQIKDAGFGSAKVYNNITTDYDFEALPSSITGNTAYIDPDAAGGGTGTELNPFNSYSTAFANASFNIYLFKSGSRFKNINSQTTIPSTRPIRLGTYGGTAPAYITSELTSVSWSQNGTYPAVYQTNNAQTTLNIGSVSDDSNIDTDGLPIALNRVANLLAVSTTANSFYYDPAADILYVRTFDTRVPDSGIRAYLNSTTLRLLRLFSPSAGGSKFYMENIHCYGAQPFVSQNTTTTDDYSVGFYNCHFSYAGQKDGFLVGVCKGFIRECRADYNIGDGFNYNATQGFIFEWKCTSKVTTDLVTPGASNGSTSHSNFVILRVGGTYLYHGGRGVADINNSFTMSIRCVVGYTFGIDPFDYAYVSNTSTGYTNMYLIECQSLDAKGYYNLNNSTMYIYDGTLGNLLTKINLDDVGSVLSLLTQNQVFV